MSEPPSLQTETKRKSKFLAVVLALIFGPLGLLYARAWWPASCMVLLGLPFILTHKGGLWLTFASRILCAVWAYYAIIELDERPNIRRDSKRLLEKAARLESSDRAMALAAYENIIRLYPDTPASAEAARNIVAIRGKS